MRDMYSVYYYYKIQIPPYQKIASGVDLQILPKPGQNTGHWDRGLRCPWFWDAPSNVSNWLFNKLKDEIPGLRIIISKSWIIFLCFHHKHQHLNTHNYILCCYTRSLVKTCFSWMTKILFKPLNTFGTEKKKKFTDIRTT